LKTPQIILGQVLGLNLLGQVPESFSDRFSELISDSTFSDRFRNRSRTQPSRGSSCFPDFKNKVDYCRIHSYDVFYNNVFLHLKMVLYRAKLPVVRAAVLAHPEAEWIRG